MVRRTFACATAVVTLSLCLAACGTSSGNASNSSTTAAGVATRGGTLTILGQSDIFNLDTVSAYYTVSNMLARTFTRQLFSYPDASTFPAELVIDPDAATTIPTSSNGGITNGGKTYTIHIKSGVMWNTTPPRQVTAADFVREFRMLCNPSSPVGAPGYFLSTIVGMQAYCNGFAKVKATVSAIDAYETSGSLPGVFASAPLTIVFHLIEPSTDFLNILALPFCSARPIEYMNYIPDSAQFRQHTLSDGPYEITQYTADKGFTLVRNPAWEQSTDTLRHAYVNKIVITEGLTAESVQEQLQAGTGDMEWDVGPPPQDLPGLAGNTGLVVGPPGPYYVSLGTYITLNQYAGPFTNKLVREAAEYAVNKNAIVQILGGPSISTVATQPILPGNVGYIKGYNPYPDDNGAGNPAMSKSLLAQAGKSGVAVKLLYSTTDPMPRVAQSLQSSLDAGGFKVSLVPQTQANFYGSYLENPTTAKRDVWDLAPPGWIPDWFGNNGRSTLEPLFTSPGQGSNDFGGYDSSTTNSLINAALAASSPAASAAQWEKAERQIMSDAAAVPVNFQKWPVFHSSAVKGCSFWWFGLNCDPTNVWLSSS
jgi:peptide/nickel transport system substrate-binding protein